MIEQANSSTGSEDCAASRAIDIEAELQAALPRGASKPQVMSRARWSKTLVNLALDAALLAMVVTLLFTAAVLRFVFPLPSASAGWMLWGFSYDAWSNLEFVLVATLGLAILLHVMLHWSWVCGVIVTKVLRRGCSAAKLDDASQTLWGVGLLIVVVNVVGLLVGLAYLTIRGPGV